MIPLAASAGARVPHPDVCFSEYFEDGLTPYTGSGDTSIFSVQVGGLSGHYLRVLAQNVGSAYVQRSFDINRPVVSFSGRVWMTSFTTDDSCGAYIVDGSGNRFGFVPRAAVGTDSLRRAAIDYGTGGVLLGSSALATDTWYRFEIVFRAGSGNSFCTIWRVDTGALVSVTNIPGVHGPFTSSLLRFFIDSSALTCITHYDGIVICPREA